MVVICVFDSIQYIIMLNYYAFMTFKFVHNWYQNICGKIHDYIYKCCKSYAQKKALQADLDKIKVYRIMEEPN